MRKSSSLSHEFRHVNNVSNINISFCAENEKQCSSNELVDEDSEIDDDSLKAPSSCAFILDNESSDSNASAPLLQKYAAETNQACDSDIDDSEDKKEHFSDASSGDDKMSKLRRMPKSELKPPAKTLECGEKHKTQIKITMQK